ncbi:biopolymer transporter ExbD [Luteolibacter ambystomatis]|uniref:Biopolymer transporter ExbD n=1 Tax=Luteolibacter ambystomatis TaxID=2824561 RepID=A0A975J168_9BACT|nr:biopolymer transporter ExbD [Luteolibacter ambystomatis]QUE52097.1 biopolymer transporter ExbD [Luteolibacter ambystomatis]
MKHHSKRRSANEASPGFQIAPMIDVVFVIMLFFMVMAGALQKEVRQFTRLPMVIPDPKDAPPIELSIRIDGDGQVLLNDDPVDGPGEGSLPLLADQLHLIKTGTEDVSVAIQAEDDVRYQRIMDVLDAVGLANIRNVTFVAGAE